MFTAAISAKIVALVVYFGFAAVNTAFIEQLVRVQLIAAVAQVLALSPDSIGEMLVYLFLLSLAHIVGLFPTVILFSTYPITAAVMGAVQIISCIVGPQFANLNLNVLCALNVARQASPELSAHMMVHAPALIICGAITSHVYNIISSSSGKDKAR